MSAGSDSLPAEATGGPESPERPLGETRVAISNAIVQIHSEQYGKGPTRAKTYVFEDLVVVVLRGGATRLDETLMRAGEGERVRGLRRAFQDSVAGQFVDRVEAITGRQVEAFLSQSETDPDVSVEVFLLAPHSGRAAPVAA
jgi:uncharacterized protein YbcI